MRRDGDGTPARVVQLTADSRGAVAVLRIYGPKALDVIASTLRLAFPPSIFETRPGRLRLGRIGAGLGDEVVVVRDSDSDAIELQCHGGPQAVSLVLQALEEAGAVRESPDNWLRHSRASPLEAEAWSDLARASTLRAAEVLLEQAQGALRNELQRLANPDLDRQVLLSGLEVLLRRSRLGLRLVDGWRVVLAGRPNVGKSQLLNALAGFDRAIVDPTAGTTRDVVTHPTAIDGWPIELADTAGHRFSTDPLEAAGIELGAARRARADLVLLVLDRSEPLNELDHALRAELPKALLVANKSDLPAAWPEESLGAWPVSALTGSGIDGLNRAIAGRLVPEPSPPGAAVPFREAHARILEDSRGLLLDNRPVEARWRLQGLLAEQVPPESTRPHD